MEVRPIDGKQRTIGVHQNRATPHMLTARKLGRDRPRFHGFKIQSLDPSMRRRPAKSRERPAEIPLSRIPLNGHHIPEPVANSRDPCSTAGGIQSTGRRLLSAVATALDRPR